MIWPKRSRGFRLIDGCYRWLLTSCGGYWCLSLERCIPGRPTRRVGVKQATGDEGRDRLKGLASMTALTIGDTEAMFRDIYGRAQLAFDEYRDAA
ncbi:MAG: hypothetical protein ACPGVG_16740 [Mycobacterium sp.]